jgi:hypothetical protein
VFFGKGFCSTCHAGADLSNHKITTNQVHLTFSAKTDAGGEFVGTERRSRSRSRRSSTCSATG